MSEYLQNPIEKD